MGKRKVVQLSDEQRSELESGRRNGRTHSFRNRCQMILLKSEHRTSVQVTQILGGCAVVVDNWVKRYEANGIEGLQTRPGRGRKAILQTQDLAAVTEAVKKSRQRISQAQAELETSLGRGKFSHSTLKRFLKKTIVATNELESGLRENR
jgi:transposase